VPVEFLVAVEHEANSREAPATSQQLVAVFGSTRRGALVTTLPNGRVYKRSGLGICQDAVDSWPRSTLVLDQTEIDRDAGVEAQVKALYQALGSDGLLFYVSRLTSPSGLPGVVRAIFAHKYPKNMAQMKLKPIFCAGGYRFFPVTCDYSYSVVARPSGQSTVSVLAKVTGDAFVNCCDQRSLEAVTQPGTQRELGLDELTVELQVGISLKPGAGKYRLEVELLKAEVKTELVAQARTAPVAQVRADGRAQAARQNWATRPRANGLVARRGNSLL